MISTFVRGLLEDKPTLNALLQSRTGKEYGEAMPRKEMRHYN